MWLAGWRAGKSRLVVNVMIQLDLIFAMHVVSSERHRDCGELNCVSCRAPAVHRCDGECSSACYLAGTLLCRRASSYPGFGNGWQQLHRRGELNKVSCRVRPPVDMPRCPRRSSTCRICHVAAFLNVARTNY